MEITKRLALACCIVLLTGLNAWSQDLFYRKNLANVKVDNLSQEQVLKFQQQIQGAKMSEQEVANYLYSKGLSREEVAKLKKRAGGLSGKDGGMSVAGNFEVLDQYFRLRDSLARGGDDSLMGVRNFGDEYVKSKEIPDSLIYGRELFANAQMRFSLDGQLPTPANYVIGPGDVLSLSLYGYQEVSTELKVLPSGQVSIPYAGMLSVAGMRIEQAAQKIGQALQQNGYASLGNGTTKLSLTVAEFRSFRVTVIGARASGNFMVPSVATVWPVGFPDPRVGWSVTCGLNSRKSITYSTRLAQHIIVRLAAPWRCFFGRRCFVTRSPHSDRRCRPVFDRGRRIDRAAAGQLPDPGAQRGAQNAHLPHHPIGGGAPQQRAGIRR